MKYDYLIVGAGIFGATCANLLTKKGHKCLVIDKSDFIGGHCRTKKVDGIDVHLYGAHIFNTSHEDVWEYVQEFGDFNDYVHKVIANYDGIHYSFPINLMTFQQLWGCVDPDIIKKQIDQEKMFSEIDYPSPQNFEEYIISKLGFQIYQMFFEGYTRKQWHKDPRELPSSIAKRIPIRYTFNDRYFFSKYQGIPVDGYTQLISNMLDECEVLLSTDYFKDRARWDSMAHNIIYTGKLDQFFDYCHGSLDYLTLRFENEKINKAQYQGNSVINYTNESVPYTRIIEHKHFNPRDLDHTIITREYSEGWNIGRAYYPSGTQENKLLAQEYMKKAEKLDRTFIGGRLGCYKYFDMDDSIKEAMNLVERIK